MKPKDGLEGLVCGMDRRNSHDSHVDVSLAGKLARFGRAGLEQVMEAVRPYATIVKHPEKPFFALGYLVMNIYELPKDFYYSLRNGADGLPFDKKVSHSLAFAEALAFFGANRGAHYFAHVVDNSVLQAVVGGLVGSEATTAAMLFLTYFSLTSITNVRRRKEQGVVNTLWSAVKETLKVSAVALPAGLAAFASADIGASAALVHFGQSPETAAFFGAIFGSVFYIGAAKAAIGTSADNGYINHT